MAEQSNFLHPALFLVYSSFYDFFAVHYVNWFSLDEGNFDKKAQSCFSTSSMERNIIIDANVLIKKPAFSMVMSINYVNNENRHFFPLIQPLFRDTCLSNTTKLPVSLLYFDMHLNISTLICFFCF